MIAVGGFLAVGGNKWIRIQGASRGIKYGEIASGKIEERHSHGFIDLEAHRLHFEARRARKARLSTMASLFVGSFAEG